MGNCHAEFEVLGCSIGGKKNLGNNSVKRRSPMIINRRRFFCPFWKSGLHKLSSYKFINTYFLLAAAIGGGGGRIDSWHHEDSSELHFLRIHFLHDRMVEVLVREESRPQYHDQANAEHHAHEGAVNQRVHAVLVPATGRLTAHLLRSAINQSCWKENS